MGELDAQAVPEVITAPEPSLLAARIDSYRVEAATSFRALQGIACQIACILENGGSQDQLQALSDAFLRTEHRAGAELLCLGAALDSCGTA